VIIYISFFEPPLSRAVPLSAADSSLKSTVIVVDSTHKWHEYPHGLLMSNVLSPTSLALKQQRKCDQCSHGKSGEPPVHFAWSPFLSGIFFFTVLHSVVGLLLRLLSSFFTQIYFIFCVLLPFGWRLSPWHGQ
jgi:hypothetical protein